MKTYAFTLLELMLVIVIIGILAVIAIPSYQKYILRSKISEVYILMDTMTKSQLNYFYNNNEFFPLPPNPAGAFSQNMTLQTMAAWTTLGYPTAVGSRVLFNYAASAGKYDDSATAMVMSSTTSTGFSNPISNVGGVRSSGAECGGLANPNALDIVPAANLNWVVLAATADFDSSALCSAIYKVIRADSTSASSISSSGFIMLNIGQ